MDAGTLMRRVFKPLLFLLCLLPLAWVAAGIGGWPPADLGANPVEKVQDTLGIWGLRLLLLTLAVTPLREILRAPRLVAYRRMLGLYGFAYILLHFLWYLFVDQVLDWRQLLADIAKRPYVTAGFSALVLLVPLAWTSTDRAMRRLGRRWQKLHRLVYPAVVLGCVHFWWQVKADIREPLVYASIAAVLLGWRLHRHRQRRRAAAQSAAAAAGQRRQRNAGQDQDTARESAPARLLAEQPPAQ
ncbi:MAG: sulfite oxidase heme-binding subunit YedZ [Gammaproteobacteria bacterium]